MRSGPLFAGATWPLVMSRGLPAPMKSVSATEPQLGDEGSISLYILPTEVVEESTPLTDHHQEPAPTVMVVLVLAEMLGQMVDSIAEKGDLHLW